MGEENNIKMSLTTVILICIIVVISIIALVFLGMKINSDMKLKQAKEEISDLKSRSDSKDKTISNLQSKLENAINEVAKTEIKVPELNQNTVDNNVNINSTNTTMTNQSNNTITNQITNTTVDGQKVTLTEQEAITIGKEKYKKALNSYWNIPVEKSDNKFNIGEYNGVYYKITDITSLKTIYSNNGFKQFMSKNNPLILEISAEYYISDSWASRGSDIFYIENELEVTNISENKIEFISNEKYKKETNEQENTIKKYKFTLVKENGIWKVDEFTLPN